MALRTTAVNLSGGGPNRLAEPRRHRALDPHADRRTATRHETDDSAMKWPLRSRRRPSGRGRSDSLDVSCAVFPRPAWAATAGAKVRRTHPARRAQIPREDPPVPRSSNHGKRGLVPGDGSVTRISPDRKVGGDGGASPRDPVSYGPSDIRNDRSDRCSFRYGARTAIGPLPRRREPDPPHDTAPGSLAGASLRAALGAEKETRMGMTETDPSPL